jgi:hypothetical protein
MRTRAFIPLCYPLFTSLSLLLALRFRYVFLLHASLHKTPIKFWTMAYLRSDIAVVVTNLFDPRLKEEKVWKRNTGEWKIYFNDRLCEISHKVK